MFYREGNPWLFARAAQDGVAAALTAQIELWQNGDNYGKEVYVLPKHLDEKVARLHLERIGANLTVLTQAQADYISVPVEGPYKPEHYRY